MRYDLDRWTAERWEKGTRYYLLEVRQDLFGEWELMRTWGRKRSHRGRVATTPTADHAAALVQLDQAATRRHKRGYLKVTP